MLYWSLHWISVFARQCIHSEGGLHIRLSLPLSVVTIPLLNISILDPITYTVKKKGTHICCKWSYGNDKLQPCQFLPRPLILGKYFITAVHQHTATGKLGSNTKNHNVDVTLPCGRTEGSYSTVHHPVVFTAVFQMLMHIGHSSLCLITFKVKSIYQCEQTLFLI